MVCSYFCGSVIHLVLMLPHEMNNGCYASLVSLLSLASLFPKLGQFGDCFMTLVPSSLNCLTSKMGPFSCLLVFMATTVLVALAMNIATTYRR